MPDWVHCATNQQVDATNTASLLTTHQAIWCTPPNLHPGGPGVPAADDRVWLVWRNGHGPVLLGGGRVLPAPRHLYGTDSLWTNPDMDGIRAAAEALGYTGGSAMSFIRLDHPQILPPPGFPPAAGLGPLAGGPSPATPPQIAILNGMLPLP